MISCSSISLATRPGAPRGPSSRGRARRLPSMCRSVFSSTLSNLRGLLRRFRRADTARGSSPLRADRSRLRISVVHFGAGLERVGEGVAESAVTSPWRRRCRQALDRSRRRVFRVFRERLRQLRGRRARIRVRAREDVGDARRDLFAIRAPRFAIRLELRRSPLFQLVPRDRAVHVHLGVRIEQLDPRRDVVRGRDCGPVFDPSSVPRGRGGARIDRRRGSAASPNRRGRPFRFCRATRGARRAARAARGSLGSPGNASASLSERLDAFDESPFAPPR